MEKRMSEQELEGEEVLEEAPEDEIEGDAIADTDDLEDDGEKAEDDTEDKARRMGWAPEDEWRGPKDRWKTADEFLSFMDEAPAVQRERLEKAGRRLSEYEGTTSDLKRQVEMLATRLKDQDKRGYERALADLKKEKRIAVENGDMDAFNEYETREDELRREAAEADAGPEEKQQTKPKEPHEITDWKSKNSWFDRDPEMTKTAEAMSIAFNQSNPGRSAVEMLEYVEKRIRGAYPDKFENPNRRDAPKTNASGTKRPSGSKKSFADLPSDAKKACLGFVEDGVYGSKDEYVADYFQQEA